MSNAFAVQTFANQLRILLQNEGCRPEQLEQLFRERWGFPLTDEQDAALRAALTDVISESKKLEELRPAGTDMLRRRQERWYLGPGDLIGSWEAYKSRLLSKPGWNEDPSVLQSIHDTSTVIVNELLNPSGPGGRRQGLVLGYVQSGKTANMMATIAKAADAGYRLVIVLAGVTNTLRLQTQVRFERDLTSLNPEQWHWLTQASHDFSLTSGLRLTLPEGQTQIMVVKKNKDVIQRLHEALELMPSKLRLHMPTLIVDDECDQASLNTKAESNEVSRINEQIRDLLELLPKVTYLGYTATPYANVLTSEIGHDGTQDLYPADFIVTIPKPEAYFGVDRLFGDQPDSVDESGDSDAYGLPMIRIVAPEEQKLLRPQSRGTREDFAPLLVPSLQEALDYYLLCLASRRVRGLGDKPCSMLVHTTLYASSHRRLSAMITEDWTWKIQADLRSGSDRTIERLRRLWDRETTLFTEEMRKSLNDAALPDRIESFDQLLPELLAAAEGIVSIVENAESDEFLDFEDQGKRHVIVIGGNILARGLTIEGLTVSYFVRASSQFDTLMQMGRWFGYRPGYSDLPRIWMTPDLNAAFLDLVVLENEIRSDIHLMSEQRLTPREFAIRIPQMPGMALTARNKLVKNNIEYCRLSYRGRHPQMIGFPADREFHDRNRLATEQFIERCAAASSPELIEENGSVLFRRISYEAVSLFLNRFNLYKESMAQIPSFIEEEVDEGQSYIRSWNVAVVGESGTEAIRSSRHLSLGGVGIQRISRRRIYPPPENDPIYIKALMSTDHVLLDLPSDIRNSVRREIRSGGWVEKQARRTELLGDDQCPLLLIYVLDKDSCGAEAEKRGEIWRIPLTHQLGEGDVVDDHIIALGFVFPDEDPNDVRPKKYLRLRLPGLSADQMDEEPDDQDPGLEVEMED